MALIEPEIILVDENGPQIIMYQNPTYRCNVHGIRKEGAGLFINNQPYCTLCFEALLNRYMNPMKEVT